MMSRFSYVALAITSFAVTLNAGQIAIGTGTAGTNGLTAGYINPTFNATTNPTPATSSSCRGSSDAVSTGSVGYNGCFVPTTGGGNVFAGNSYSSALFSNASPITPPTTGGTITAGGTTFELVNDSANPTRNFWITNAGAAASQIVVPVGIYGVSKTWTLLNDYWGGVNLNNTSVIFTFDDSSNGGAGANPVKTVRFDLVNGQTIRAGVNYSAAAGGSGTAVTNTGVNIATTLSGTYNANSGCATCTVTAGNAFTSTANYSTASSPYVSTTGGKTVLDYQLFDFGTNFSSDFLVSITIRNALIGTTTGSLNSRAALSAITVNQIDAVPEPSTVFLTLSGLALFAYKSRRWRS